MSNIDRRVENFLSMYKTGKDVIQIEDENFKNFYNWADNWLEVEANIYNELYENGRLKRETRAQTLYEWNQSSILSGLSLSSMDARLFTSACNRFYELMKMAHVKIRWLKEMDDVLMRYFAHLFQASMGYKQVKKDLIIDRFSELSGKNLNLMEEIQSKYKLSAPEEPEEEEED